MGPKADYYLILRQAGKARSVGQIAATSMLPPSKRAHLKSLAYQQWVWNNNEPVDYLPYLNPLLQSNNFTNNSLAHLIYGGIK
jgi:hypothetical protein